MPRSLALALPSAVLALVTTARSGAAQEIQLTGPLISPGPSYAMAGGTARVEWDSWVGTGAVVDVAKGLPAQVSPFASAGLEVTFGAATYTGFPAPVPYVLMRKNEHYMRHHSAEVRVGPFVQGETRSPGGLLEGGLTVHLGVVDDDVKWLFVNDPPGMFDLRVAGGYGAFPGRRSPDVAASLAWGYRFVFGRRRLVVVPSKAPTPKLPVADATLFRLVTTARRATALPAWEVVLGVEVSPTVVLIAPRIFRDLRLQRWAWEH